VKRCSNPIDPIDAEALAAGAEPVLAPDAGAHVRECLACQERVESAGQFTLRLEEPLPDRGPGPDLVERVLRLRAFSRREKRDFTLWRGAAALAVGVFFAGLLLASLPALTGREQADLGLAAAAPLLALFRSLARSLANGAATAPAALDALAQSFRGQSSIGVFALALLAPVLLGFRWALARARR
jgi:hypothetical protein